MTEEETVYTEKGSIEPLSEGKTVKVRGMGNSMTPLLQSGDTVTVEPITSDTKLEKGDIVIAKVKGRVYLHLIKGTKKGQVLIGNNHGHDNGWTSENQIYGKVITSHDM